MQINDRYFLNPAHLELARARYFLKDENGEPVEQDIDEVFCRVVDHIYSKDQSNKKEALRLRREKKIIDGGRPLAQSGTKVKNILNCFVKNTMISSTSGPKKIQDVVVGDNVISHKGRVQVVSQVHKNPLGSRDVFNIKCARTPDIKVTGNHRFWTINNEDFDAGPHWESVEDLSVGDYIAIPKPIDGELTEEHILDVSSYLNTVASDVKIHAKQYSLAATTYYRNIGEGKYTSSRAHKTIKRMWKVDSDFALFIGVWLGDGCVYSNNIGKNVGITFTTNLKEVRLHRFIRKYGANLLGVDPIITVNVEQNTKVIAFNSQMIGCIFEEMFGRGFDGKHLGSYMFGWSKRLVSSLLSGVVTSDGTIASNGTCKIEIRNSKLIEQLYHVSRQCGIPVSKSNGYVLYKGEKRSTNKLNIPKGNRVIANALKQYEDQRIVESVIYKTTKWKAVNGLLENDNQYFVRLNKKDIVDCHDDYVYTIGVDNDHSYNVEGLLCENCFVVGFADDTREAISELKRKHFNIQSQGGGTGINFSSLRPKGSICKATQSRSSGATGFITDFSYQSSNISQPGNRSGANMGVMEDWHPDLYEFITKKSNSNWENIRKFATVYDEDAFSYFQWQQAYQWQMFNVSVFISDEFMSEVLSNSKKPWKLQWKGTPWRLWKFKNSMGPKTRKSYNYTTVVTAPNEDMARYKASSEIPFFKVDHMELVEGPYDLTAKEWFGMICQNAWEDGCPGIIFADQARKYHNAEYFNPLVATNPCFSGDTLVAVADGRGAVRIDELAKNGEDVPVYSVNSSGSVEIKMGRHPRKTRKGVSLVRVTLDDGTYLDVTPNHRFLLRDGTVKEAKGLKSGDSLPRFTKRPEEIKAGGKKYLRINCNTFDSSKDRVFEHRLIAKFHNAEVLDQKYSGEKNNGWVNGGIVVHHKDYNSINNRPDNLEIMSFFDHARIHGLVDNNGENNPMYGRKHSDETKNKIGAKTIERCKNPDYRERLSASLRAAVTEERRKNSSGLQINRNIEIWKKIEKETDCDTIWVDNRLHVKKDCKNCNVKIVVSWSKRSTVFCSPGCHSGWNKRFSDTMFKKAREALCNKQEKTFEKQINIYNDLKISLGRDSLKKEWENKCRELKVSFRLRPGDERENILSSFKQLKKIAEVWNHRVISVVDLSEKQDVYNITVDDNYTVGVVTEFYKNTGKCSGIFVFQCAEQIMPLNAVCCLTSLPLPSFFVDGVFDWDEFRVAIRQAIRGLDNIISINKTGEKDIDETSLRERRIGLGTTGIAELLINMNLKYSSQKGRNFVGKILSFLRDEAYETSVELAKERGSFEAYDYKGISQSEFFKSLPEHIRNLIRRHGLRNVTLLTQAPVGTTGTMIGFATGCEPYFAMAFTRNSRVGSFQDGSPAFIKWLDENDIDYSEYNYNLAKLRGKMTVPDYFEEAHEISWLDHLKMQAVFAKHVDSSVSKTINMPNSATVEDIENTYINAFKMGIKSTTVYRDGSKQQILEHIMSDSVSHRPKEIVGAHAPKRPKNLDCDIHHTSVKGVKWTVLVGILDGKPYEIFCAPQESFELSTKYKRGNLVKNGKGSYYLDMGDFKIKSLSMYLQNDEHRVITRLLSTALRHGVPMKFLADQLAKTDGTIVDFSKAMLRVLKKYDTVTEYFDAKDLVCQSCGSGNVILKGGCPECMDCGVTKCD